MITFVVQGGLGNQLFQYAYGRALMACGKDVVFDTSFFEADHKYTKRPYLLDKFLIGDVIKTTKEHRQQNLFTRIINKIDIDRKVRYVAISKDADNYIADGYYVSEKYFKDIRDSILSEVVLKNPSELFLTWKAKIQSAKNPLMIHARRTDHVANKTFTLLDEHYYKKAIQYFDDDCEIFGFSDAPEWLHGILPNKKITIVSGQGLTECEEMLLMSLGKNFIIANSTYSWWGAWLSQHKDKKIVVIKKWYRSIFWWRANRDVEFSGWVRI